ncbi:Repressor of RNA polymerase III transcription MAF1 [Amphibalanus amphitrite]|uniref:Repressor of RNA polymerase III transcription MAF1 n=1 Tax=Amphibalanus amphitrite TaxID=1232801 RepID=A0A6A4VI19_AMPAM|nr:repressor of RNA polymerase III transcription MAF1 homolog isoform X1 [Amphibalanus amphitrite]KAF0289988.1 Repressor of RNA polymerase III transcription MAF1 [Amphibalanus amphitrite]
MKLLENSSFEAITSGLQLLTGSSRIFGRVESYSCKMVGPEKSLYKKLNFEHGHNPSDLQALSPPENKFGVSPSNVSYSFPLPSAARRSRSLSGDEEGGGSLCDVISRKALFHLISTLNASFPDYDFSSAKAEEFSREPSLAVVVANIDTYLSAAAGEQYNVLRNTLWRTIEDEITPKECDIYRYNPDLQSDPFGEDGCLWSFNYFFYNKKMKRIVFFTCRAISVNYNMLRLDSGSGQEFSMELDEDYMLGLEEEVDM